MSCGAFLFGAHGEMGRSRTEEGDRHWQRGARSAVRAAHVEVVTEKDGSGMKIRDDEADCAVVRGGVL